MTEREAFTEWARSRQLALLRTAVLLTGDHHRAEDLVQEALAKVALRWSRLESGHPEAYARQVMARDHISWWRKRRREVVTDIPDGAGPAPDPDRSLVIRSALAGLTPRQRAVVVLRYYDDLSVEDTALAMGVSQGTVKSQTHLALRRLREAMPELAELLREES
ncbi:SigE family RNA polymerase sigma factor [Nocardioides sp.]|uniref:SigE family RNA polymerase sigma factor n=1 Tax=Nocardioides sp. TaxID=35761 RepID=UPI003D145CE4